MAEIVRNMFSLEGIDGSGKTTQCTLLKELLESQGLKVALLKSPSTTVLGEFIRANVRNFKPRVRNQLFLLDMNSTIRCVQEDSNAILLWDRYLDSFYSSNREMTYRSAQALVKNMPQPNRTFWLDIKPEDVVSLRATAVHSHSDPEWLALKVRRYQELWQHEQPRMVRINALLSRTEIACKIAEGIKEAMAIYGY